MHFAIVLAHAAFAAGAVAWRQQTDEDINRMSHEESHVHHAREADAMATRAWEHAHGGKAPSYKAFPEHEHHARSLPHFGEHEVDTSLEGYDHELAQAYLKQYGQGHFARSIGEEDEGAIDYSLDGYDHDLVARYLAEDHHEEVDYSLEGYDHTMIARSTDEDEIDYSPEGYDHELVARNAEPLQDDDILARSEGSKTWAPKDWKQQAWSKHLSHLSAHKTHTGTDSHPAYPTNVARGIKDVWEHFTKKIDQGTEKQIKGAEHVGEEIKNFFARDAKKEWPEHEDADQLHHHEHKHEHAQHTHVARGMPYEYAGHHNEPLKPHRPLEALGAEAVMPHSTAHPTHVVSGHAEEWTKHTPVKTAHSTKSTGGWGFPW